MMLAGRLDRQMRIEGWDQGALESARLGIVGDDDLLASFFLMSAAALGLNDIVVIAPRIDQRLLGVAQQLNQDLDVKWVEGFYTHPAMDELFDGCNVLVDLSRYGLANKLIIEKAFRADIPVVRGFRNGLDGQEGFKIFTYMKAREWEELQMILSPSNLPVRHSDDPVLGIIASGIVLEEVKNYLMGRPVSEELIEYNRSKLLPLGLNTHICVVGAGALGNFVGLGLAYSGFRNITFIDPDVVELTNLNRQVLFGGRLGLNKADAIASRLSSLFGIKARSRADYLRADSDISSYDVIFDCVDNFETRIILSEKCKAERKVLIGGGTSVEAGQAIVYDPSEDAVTPAELLGMYGIVEGRKAEAYRRERTSCRYEPDPSVIMTNQIIAGFMVDAYRMFLNGYRQRDIFYDAKSDRKI